MPASEAVLRLDTSKHECERETRGEMAMSVRENGALTRDQAFPSLTFKLLTLDHHHCD
jgi:hypothetical protein